MLLPLTAVAYALIAVFCQFAPGTQPTPSVALLVEAGLWFQLYVGVMLALGLGGWRTLTRDA